MFNRKRKGFSLIELLIVIAIIGIIATIAIPILLSAREGAVQEKARNSLRSVISAEFAYYAANGQYGSEDDLTGATPPFIDAATFDPAQIGNAVDVQVTANSATAFEASATFPWRGATRTYTCNETGAITE